MKFIYQPLLLFLITIVGSGCAKFQEPEFRRVERFRIKNLGLQSTVIGFSVTYYNPNNFGVTVKETEADVYMDSIYLGKFQQDSTVGVNKNAEFSIPMSGAVSIQTALQMDLQNIGERDILLKADGTVKVGKAGIFISKPIHYEGRHRIDEFKF